MNTAVSKDTGTQPYLERYYLQKYLYSGDQKLLEGASGLNPAEKWNRWRYAVLVESGKRFFDRTEGFEETLAAELRREFFYLNLNAGQSLLLFQDEYCDYKLIVSHMRQILRRKYAAGYYFAISRRFTDYHELPSVFEKLEQQMDERFYHPERFVFSADEEKALTVHSEVQDSMVIDKISEDVSRKDIDHLWKHFGYLKEKYTANTHYSAMYVRFVFSNVIQEIYSEEEFAAGRDMSAEITRLYQTVNLAEIMGIIEENISAYEEFINSSRERLGEEVRKAGEYIKEHCTEELTPEMLSGKIGLSTGYLSFIFRKETGMSIPRYFKVCRMEKAHTILTEEKRTVSEAAAEVGFGNVQYFEQAYREYFGIMASR